MDIQGAVAKDAEEQVWLVCVEDAWPDGVEQRHQSTCRVGVVGHQTVGSIVGICRSRVASTRKHTVQHFGRSRVHWWGPRHQSQHHVTVVQQPFLDPLHKVRCNSLVRLRNRLEPRQSQVFKVKSAKLADET